MHIFYPEYAISVVLIVIAGWRILRDVPDAESKKRNERIARKAGRTPDEKKPKEKKKGE